MWRKIIQELKMLKNDKFFEFIKKILSDDTNED